MTKIAYCTVANVREIVSLTTSDISDADVTALISYATTRLNAEICVRVKDEKVGYLTREKENDIDGTNTTYYTKSFPIGDYDNDGAIGTSDIIAYTIDSDGTRASATVSAINDDEIGKFTLSAAPASGVELYLTYYYVPLDCETPHPLIKQACIFLVSAMASTKIGADNFKTLSLGRMRFSKFSPEYDSYMSKYNELVADIVDVGFREKGKSLIEMIQ